MKHAGRLVPVMVCILTLLAATHAREIDRKVLAGSEPQATVTVSAVDWVEYIDRNRLLAIRHPQDWSVSKQEAIAITPSEFSAADLSVLPHAPVLAIVQQGAYFPETETAQDALEFWIESLGSNWDDSSTTFATDTAVLGQPLASAQISGTDRRTGIAFEMRLFPIRLSGEDGLVIAVAPQTLWTSAWPTMQTMLTTLRLLSPEALDAAPAPTQTPGLVWQTVGLGSLNSTDQPAKPQAIAIGPNGEIYVIDTGVDLVQVYSPQGIHLSSFGEHGSEPGQFDFRSQGALTVDGNGNIYVVDPGNWRVQKLDPRGTPELVIGADELSFPRDVAISTGGQIFVTDGDGGTIHVFDEAGRPVRQIELPVGEEQSPRPQGIAVGPDGNIYVTIPSMQRVLVLDEVGYLQAELGRQSSETSTWAWPVAVAVDEAGNVYVADSELGKIERFAAGGQLLTIWDAGDMSQPVMPTDLTVDRHGTIYLTDGEGKRVLRLVSPGAIAGNLQLTNGSFEYGLAGWKQLDAQQVITEGQAIQIYEEEAPYWLVLGLNKLYDGDSSGQAGVFQPLDIPVRGLTDLRLAAQVMVISEEGENIGGPDPGLVPEGAVLFRMFFRDADGHNDEWYHGFYAKNVPNSDSVHYTTVPLETWYPYESDNLLAEFPEMDTITGLQIYGEGTTFIGRVDDVRLLSR